MLNHRIFNILQTLKNHQLFSFAALKPKGPNFEQDFSEFLSTQKTKTITSGRSWKSEQLRLKSNEDLHKLWFVCVKEKNVLLADQIIQKRFTDANVLQHRVSKVKTTMDRILAIVKEREQIRKDYRLQLENEYIDKKRNQLRDKVEASQQVLPQITWQMLRDKYLQLRKGIDNTKYLERICNCLITKGIKKKIEKGEESE